MQFKWTNTAGLTATIKQAKPIHLDRINGTGSLTATSNTFKAPLQDGEFIVNRSLNTRNITIEGRIYAENGKATGTDYAYQTRAELIRLFSPKATGTLEFRGRIITAEVEECSISVDNRERLPTFFISLLCADPYFRDGNGETILDLTAWEGGFEFELEIPDKIPANEDEWGVEFGTRVVNQLVTIPNYGDVPCGLVIRFSTYGEVTNPEFMNVATGEFIRLLTTITAGQEYFIDTNFSNKRVWKIEQGIRTNAFALIDPQSTFFSLPVGDTLFKYDASDGMEILDVRVMYTLRFLGV